MTQIKLDLDSYSLRVLDVVKGMHGLKNRNDAFKVFVQEFGDKYTQMNIKEEILRQLDDTFEKHTQKQTTKSMSEQELDTLLGL